MSSEQVRQGHQMGFLERAYLGKSHNADAMILTCIDFRFPHLVVNYTGQFTVSRCPVWRRVHRPAMRFGEVPPRCWLRPWSAASRSSRFGRQPSLQDRNACGSARVLAHCDVTYVVRTILTDQCPRAHLSNCPAPATGLETLVMK